MDSKNICLICGSPLKYSETISEKICSICGGTFLSNAECINGHFVCDACHAEGAYAGIKYTAMHAESNNPAEIADKMMSVKGVHMHGPEHHIIAGAALLAAYSRCGGEIDLPSALNEIERRGSMVPGGFCGLAGACGAAVSVGMALSIILKATPLSKKEWAECNELTGRCLLKISGCGGPRCCKRDVFLSLTAGAEYIRELTGAELEISEKIKCRYSSQNRECLGNDCPYHLQD